MEIGMDYREMIRKRPRFEVKSINEDKWKMISEKELLLNLFDAYTLITPIIVKMFEGEEIETPSAMYRIRI